MTVRRVDQTVLLEGVCSVEEAETLMQEIQGGAAVIDWTRCGHLHTACLQVVLVSGLPIRGVPVNATLARWLPGMVPTGMQLDFVDDDPAGGAEPDLASADVAKPIAAAESAASCLTEA